MSGSPTISKAVLPRLKVKNRQETQPSNSTSKADVSKLY
jgi:hypothetical protein